jgi:hypothetical protein
MVFKSYRMIKPQVQEKESNQRKLISLQRKELIKIECMLTNRIAFYWQLPLNRGKICIILVDSPYKQQQSL